MKFSRRLDAIRAADTSPLAHHYLNYKLLKRILRGTLPPPPALASSSPLAPHAALSAFFFHVFTSELTRTTTAFLVSLARFSTPLPEPSVWTTARTRIFAFLSRLLTNPAIPPLDARLPPDEAARYRDAYHLFIFASANALAIRKILKKFDKLTNTHRGAAWWTTVGTSHPLLANELMRPLEQLAERGRVLCEIDGTIQVDDFLSKSNTNSIAPEVKNAEKDHLPGAFAAEEKNVENDHVPDAFTCPVCLEVLFKPTRLRCGHALCVLCFERIWARAASRCPICRCAAIGEGAVGDRALDRFIEAVYAERYEERRRDHEKAQYDVFRSNIEYIYKLEF